MSLVRRLGVTSPVAGTLLSMIEVFFFFCVLTVVYFVACSSLYKAIHNHLSLGSAVEQAGKNVVQAQELLKKVQKAHDRIVPLAATQPGATTQVSDEDRTQMLTDAANLIDEAAKLAKLIVTNRNTATPVRSDELKRQSQKGYDIVREAHALAIETRDKVLTPEKPTEPLDEKIPAAEAEMTVGSFFVSSPPFFQLSLFKIPVWVWFIQGGLYLLLVTIYWAPGEQAVNENELRALVLSILLAVVILIVVFHETVWQFVETFLKILGIWERGAAD